MNAVVTLLKGQVVIPQQIQEMLGIDDGDSFRVEADPAHRKIILTYVPLANVLAMYGKYRGKGLLKALMQEKQQEREKE